MFDYICVYIYIVHIYRYTYIHTYIYGHLSSIRHPYSSDEVMNKCTIFNSPYLAASVARSLLYNKVTAYEHPVEYNVFWTFTLLLAHSHSWFDDTHQ